MCPENESGGTGNQSGAQEGQNNGGDQNQPKTVPLADHKKMLDEMHVAKNQAKLFQSEIENLKTQLQSIKTKGAESSGDYKSLYEQATAAKTEIESKFNDFRSNVYNDKRIEAVESVLKQRGLKESAKSVLDFIDLDKLPVELTSRGRILVHGVEEQATELQKKYEFAFAKGDAPNINNGGGASGAGVEDSSLTAQYMTDLEKSDPKKYRELMPRYLAAYKKRITGG